MAINADTRTTWDFREDNQKWTIFGDIDDRGVDSQNLGRVYYVTGDSPRMYSEFLNFNATEYPLIYIKMASQTANCARILFQRQGDSDMSFNRSIEIPVNADGETRTYVVDMRDNTMWTGNIIRLRLDPACEMGGNNAVRIDKIRIKGSEPSVWDFRNDDPRWVIFGDLDDRGVDSQNLGRVYYVTGNSPRLYTDYMNFSATEYPLIYIKMASQTVDCARVLFQRQGDTGVSFDRSVEIPVNADSETRTYVVDMRDNTMWTGDIIRLRLDPACQMGGNNAVRIDKIRLETVEPTTWDFRDNDQKWTPFGGTLQDDGVDMENLGRRYTVTGSDPRLYTGYMNIDAAEYSFLYVRMSTRTDDCVSVFFQRQGDVGILNQPLDNPVNIGGTHAYIINLNDNVFWDGEITRLRFDPACQTGMENILRIDEIRLLTYPEWIDMLDVNSDNMISPTDVIYVINRIGSNDLSADVDKDNNIDNADVEAVRSQLGN